MDAYMLAPQCKHNTNQQDTKKCSLLKFTSTFFQEAKATQAILSVGL